MNNNRKLIRGKLYLNDSGRLALDDGCNGEYEFHCSYGVELYLCNKWLSTRIEADINGKYYAVGLNGLKLEGVTARVII